MAKRKTTFQDWITVKGAREHNLKDVSVKIPKNALVVITGPSGSGKSSLALDVLYVEGKRRYTESLSTYARQFLGIVGKPDVDSIEGLCPAIAIEQKTVGSNPRSTVGTITEIYDYLRVLYARIGIVHCPTCKKRVKAESPEEIATIISTRFADSMVYVYAPIANQKKGEFTHELIRLFESGYYRMRIDGTAYKFAHVDDIKNIKLQKTYKHTIDVLIDVITNSHEERPRLQASIEKAFSLAKGLCKVIVNDEEYIYSSMHTCTTCGDSIPEFEPRNFSFNSPIGACDECQGLGVFHGWQFNDTQEFSRWAAPSWRTTVCKACSGKRLNAYARAVTIGGLSITDLAELSAQQMQSFFNEIKLDSITLEIAQTLFKEIQARLSFLRNVGLSYLTINRPAHTLSGGEGQRIRLATQIGSMLTGVLYVLDEPSIGLHQRDNDMLISTLEKLRDIGNTVIVVEHDLETISRADYIIEMGPAAGINGGKIVAVGTPKELTLNEQSLTGGYLSGRLSIKKECALRQPRAFIVLEHLTKNNLKNIAVKFPLGVLCGVSGVSGSGKSTLIMQELVTVLEQQLNLRSLKKRAEYAKNKKSHHVHTEDVIGMEHIESLILIDQSPIGRTPRSNPATYLGIFDDVRKLYAQLPESQARGYKVGRFSFNTLEGRCFECSGDGIIKYAMHFLPEVIVVCKSCKGKRYNEQTLDILYKGKHIADILTMTAFEALTFFENHKKIAKRVQLLCDVGLDYLTLGQPSNTLSGGEAQRIKLVDELVKRGQHTLYVLDEPTTGLHNSDIDRLLKVLNSLVDKGNSMIVIEHNIDVLKTVDYIIDLGPEGGLEGGYIVATGTPEQISIVQGSHTARYLRPFFTSN